MAADGKVRIVIESNASSAAREFANLSAETSKYERILKRADETNRSSLPVYDKIRQKLKENQQQVKNYTSEFAKLRKAATTSFEQLNSATSGAISKLRTLALQGKENTTEFKQLANSIKKNNKVLQEANVKVEEAIKLEDKLEQETKETQKSFLNLRGAISATALALGALKIKDVTLDLVKLASEAEETANKFNVTFGSVAKNANAAAKSLANSYGLANDEAQKLLSNTGDLLTGFGFTQDAALDLSAQVNKLAVDLASFTNLEGGATRASEALTKALLGERESVKSLGIAILEEDVKAKVKALEISGQLTNQSEREKKAIATLAIAYEQSKNAIGDFQRSQESFANQSRILESTIRDLRVEIGNELLPVFSELVGTVTSFLRDNQEQIVAATKAFTEYVTRWVQGVDIIIGKIDQIFGRFRKAELEGTDTLSKLVTFDDKDILFKIDNLEGRIKKFRDAAAQYRDGTDIKAGFETEIERLTAIQDSLKRELEVRKEIATFKAGQAEAAPTAGTDTGIQPSNVININEFRAAKEEIITSTDEINQKIGVTSEDVTAQLSDAITSPFTQGVSAAESFGQAVGNIVGQIVDQFIQLIVIKPVIDALFNKIVKSAKATEQIGTGLAKAAVAAPIAARGTQQFAQAQATAAPALAAGAVAAGTLATAYTGLSATATVAAVSTAALAVAQAAFSTALIPFIGGFLAPVAALATGAAIGAGSAIAGAGLAAGQIAAGVGAAAGGGLTKLGGAFADGAAFSNGNVIPFANGGVVTSPTTFPMSGGRTGLMGEAGAEAIMPLKRGNDGKLGVSASTPAVNVYNQTGAQIETVARPDGEMDIFIKRMNMALDNERTNRSFRNALDRQQEDGVQAV